MENGEFSGVCRGKRIFMFADYVFGLDKGSSLKFIHLFTEVYVNQ